MCCQLMHNSDPDVLKRFSGNCHLQVMGPFTKEHQYNITNILYIIIGCCENKTGRSMMVLKLLFKFILVIIIYLLLIMPLIKDTSSAEYNHYDVCSGISDVGCLWMHYTFMQIYYSRVIYIVGWEVHKCSRKRP